MMDRSINLMNSERGGCGHHSRNRVAQALGKTTVEQIVEIVSAHRPAGYWGYIEGN
jgi:hypothetical protein